jgi:hypothetical protein
MSLKGGDEDVGGNESEKSFEKELNNEPERKPINVSPFFDFLFKPIF